MTEIKIVEFDRDDELSPAARPNEKKGIKIIEFDNDRDDSREGGRKTAATARDLGPIKIVEFDDDRPSGGPSGPSGVSEPSSAPETPRPVAKAIKIRGFRRGSRGRPAERNRQKIENQGDGVRLMIREADSSAASRRGAR